MTDGQSRHITSKWCDIALTPVKYLHLWNFQPLGVSSRGKVVFWYAVIVFLGFGSRTSPHVCLGRNIYNAQVAQSHISIDMIWLSIHRDSRGTIRNDQKKKFSSQSGLWDKITQFHQHYRCDIWLTTKVTNWRCMQLKSSEYSLYHCSVYFGIKLDHSLTCKHLTKLKSWSVSWP